MMSIYDTQIAQNHEKWSYLWREYAANALDLFLSILDYACFSKDATYFLQNELLKNDWKKTVIDLYKKEQRRMDPDFYKDFIEN